MLTVRKLKELLNDIKNQDATIAISCNNNLHILIEEAVTTEKFIMLKVSDEYRIVPSIFVIGNNK
jgi:hypothetical protein